MRLKLVKIAIDKYLRRIIREEVTPLLQAQFGGADRPTTEVPEIVITPDVDVRPNDVPTSMLVVQPGEMAPWIQKAEEFNGLMESDDRDVLEPFLGVNPDDQDGGIAWCAAFVNKVLEACDIQSTDSLRAVDYENWGQECEKRDNAIAVFGPGTGAWWTCRFCC